MERGYRSLGYVLLGIVPIFIAGFWIPYMICIVLALFPAGMARTLGYWFNWRQSSSQTACLAAVNCLLVGLIALDVFRKKSVRPYAFALLAYLNLEVIWFFLGRPV